MANKLERSLKFNTPNPVRPGQVRRVWSEKGVLEFSIGENGQRNYLSQKPSGELSSEPRSLPRSPFADTNVISLAHATKNRSTKNG